MLRPSFSLLLAAAFGPALSSAQVAPALPTGLSFRAPVHVPPGGTSAELHASGDGFKVVFSADVAFLPVLGAEAPRSLPLRWRTSYLGRERGTPLPAASLAERRAETWAVEYLRGAVRERYDVRAEGLEQSFVLEAEPEGEGDFVVRGLVSSELACAPREPLHAPLQFRDTHGDPVASYGAAQVFDAAGRALALETAYDGEQIELRVPERWLEEARYPVVIDPLLARATLATGTAAVSSVAICAAGRVCVVATRDVSSTDGDLYSWILDTDLSSPVLVVADLDPMKDHGDAQAAYARGVSRFAIGARLSSSGFGLRVHPALSTQLHYGIEAFLPVSTSPLALSNGSTDEVALAWEGSGQVVEVLPVRLTDNPLRMSTQRVSENFPSRTPSISEDLAGGWMVAYAETRSGEPWRCVVARLDDQGAVVRRERLIGAPQSTRHELQPRIAGDGDRFLLSFGQDDSATATQHDQISLRRFDWPASAPVLSPLELDVLAPATTNTSYRNLALAPDGVTDSFWGAGYARMTNYGTVLLCARLSDRAALLESAIAATSSALLGGPLLLGPGVGSALSSPAGAFFPLVHASSEAQPLHPIYVQAFAHADARVVAYGNACAGLISATRPYAGLHDAAVRLIGGGVSRPAFLMLGAISAAVPLDGLGAPGCTLLVDPLVTLGLLTTTSGAAELHFALPDRPALVGDVYAQWAWIPNPASSNATPIATTGGLQLQIR